jgi:hypothetical protein
MIGFGHVNNGKFILTLPHWIQCERLTRRLALELAVRPDFDVGIRSRLDDAEDAIFWCQSSSL